MSYSISMAEKPVPHTSEADWKAKIWNMRAEAQTKTNNSFDLRNDVRMTRNEAVISRRWANYHNNVRIADRITEVRRCMNKLGGALQNLKSESELLMAEKFETEKELEKYCSCLQTLSECKFLRDTKAEINLINDDVVSELRLEIDTLESTKKYLSNKCISAWEQNNRLVELIYKIENDLADKTEAIQIDLDVLKLDNTSITATYKPDVLNFPSSVIPLELWTERATFSILTADNECQTALKLRESMVLSRQRCKMDFLAQYEATNYAMRKRLYETMRLKTELEFQKKSILEEMAKVTKELDRITKCKEETIQYLKCAESRLESRHQRPCAESTRDEALMGLYEEVLLLRKNIEDIDKRIAETQNTYNQLESYLMQVDTEIQHQEQSLEVDKKALEIHESLITLTPISQVDYNIELLNLSKEMPPEQPVVR